MVLNFNTSVVIYICLNLLSVICVINCETVFFTNSQTRIENAGNEDRSSKNLKTYQLDVPGSSPITIIEAEPLKNADLNERYSKALNSDYETREYNERRSKDYVVPGSTHETEDIMQFGGQDRCHGESCSDSKKTVYSPDLLNKFLQEYAERIKNADKFTKDKLHEMEITTQRNDYEGSANYEKKKVSGTVNIQIHKDGNRRYWDEVDAKRHRHPYDDPEGWVALEAVPWSRSKISKWQANAQKVNKPNNGNGYNSFNNDENEPDVIYSDKVSTYERPDMEHEYQAQTHQNSYQSPKPSMYDYNKKPYSRPPQYDDEWENETPKPTWAKPPKSRPSFNNRYEVEKKPHKPDCDHTNNNNEDDVEDLNGYNRRVSSHYYDKDIIVDNGPNDFPPMPQEYTMPKQYNKKPHEESYNDFRKFRHPSSYPTNGNGQWVLLSTTKGYKAPKNRERSLSIFPKPLVAHRSVRLTVLPAKDTSKENATLSHGGLLEVDPSFETVEESKRIYEKIQAINDATIKRKGTKTSIVTTNPTPDASAVVAAVGAGLVPATVAMIMPMMLGRKKRSVASFVNFVSVQNVTQTPNMDYESSLQKNMY